MQIVEIICNAIINIINRFIQLSHSIAGIVDHFRFI